MLVSEIANALEAWAPTSLAESYDNVGLLVGLRHMPVTGVLVTLDVTEAVLEEAIQKGCNLIVAHHPIWFTPRKRLNGEDFVSRIILQAIKKDIALYACHTNLDNVRSGVNAMIGQRLGVQQQQILSPKRDMLLQVVAYGSDEPIAQAAEALRSLHFQPVISPGAEGMRLELLIPAYLKSRAAGILSQTQWHVLPVQGMDKAVGSGMIGSLPKPMPKADFLAHVKAAFGCGGIRYADAPLEQVSRVAWCGGAGSFLIQSALDSGADALVTADITYHKFFEQENRMLLLDIGHYESEQFTSELIARHLLEKFPNFAVRLSDIVSNPVKYY